MQEIDWSLVPWAITAVGAITLASIIHALRLVLNWFFEWRKEIQRQKVVIEALMIEIRLMRQDTTRFVETFTNGLKDGTLEKSINKDAKYYPYVPVLENKTVAFDTFKKELFFLEQAILEGLVELYLDDQTLFEYVYHFGSDNFKALEGSRKLGALNIALELARRLNSAADSVLAELDQKIATYR